MRRGGAGERIEPVRPLRFADGALEILDQTRLPGEEVWLRLTKPEQVIEAIQQLRVRGAPLIGVAGAYAQALDRLDHLFGFREAEPDLLAREPRLVEDLERAVREAERPDGLDPLPRAPSPH